MGDHTINLNALPGYALRRAANAMMAELGGRLSGLGLRVSEVTVMIMIDGRSDVTASEIARKLDIKRTNMVPLLKRLETGGFISRQSLDGKSQAITLTGEGLMKLDAARREIVDFEAGLAARIPAEHRPHFLPALQALYYDHS